MVVQNICAMKAASVDAAASLKQRGKPADNTGELTSKKAGSGQSELRTHIRELLSCALVSPRPLRMWRTITDVLSVQLDAHLAIGEVTHDFPAQSCAIGLLIAQLLLLHLDASRHNGFSAQAQTAISIARCIYFLSPAKIWSKDVLTFQQCFKPWAFAASSDPVHCSRRWTAALALAWLRVAKACSCDELGGCGGNLPSSILSTLPSDWSPPESWTTVTTGHCDWAAAIATECSAVADDTNFPVPFARVVLFYAARMARKLSVPPAVVLQLLRAAHEITDPKDILGPCDIDLPTTWLVSYQFKFLSAVAFSRAAAGALPRAESEDIVVAGRELSEELDKCRRIGSSPSAAASSLLLIHVFQANKSTSTGSSSTAPPSVPSTPLLLQIGLQRFPPFTAPSSTTRQPAVRRWGGVSPSSFGAHRPTLAGAFVCAHMSVH